MRIDSIMNLMKIIFKKIAPVMIVFALLFIVGIFFGGSDALASGMSGSMMNCEDGVLVSHDVHCDTYNNQGIQKNDSAGDTFMPCCLQRHDNSETTIPSVLQERIKFSEYSIIGEIAGILSTTEQKTYLSSKSPPKKADILSSVVKIE